jgi:hypothetical protein
MVKVFDRFGRIVATLAHGCRFSGWEMSGGIAGRSSASSGCLTRSSAVPTVSGGCLSGSSRVALASGETFDGRSAESSADADGQLNEVRITITPTIAGVFRRDIHRVRGGRAFQARAFARSAWIMREARGESELSSLPHPNDPSATRCLELRQLRRRQERLRSPTQSQAGGRIGTGARGRWEIGALCALRAESSWYSDQEFEIKSAYAASHRVRHRL